jgi:hypothetical protein
MAEHAHMQRKSSPGAEAISGRAIGRVRVQPVLERQAAFRESVAAARPNRTGLPQVLKSGMEALSGFSLDDVQVHYNSSRPARLHARAFAQGNQIHLASGQEHNLPHEAWHVVQQKQGRVFPTASAAGYPLNDAPQLEQEADAMGQKALAAQSGRASPRKASRHGSSIQRVVTVGPERFSLVRGDTRELRTLLSAVQAALQRKHLDLNPAGARRIRIWCGARAREPRGANFQSYDDVAERLIRLRLFKQKKVSFRSMGPRGLGRRPVFKGLAAKLKAGKKHGDTARRHVISSSTLGVAIENAGGTLQDVNAFLARNGLKAETTLTAARVSAWHLVHNHTGNLWVGPSPINSAIGFIRAPIQEVVAALRKSAEEVSPAVITDALRAPQGPLNKQGRLEWTLFVEVVSAAIASEAGVSGLVRRDSVIEFLVECSRNADLDLPETTPGGSYFVTLRRIYALLLGAIQTGSNIFTPNGALDQFMKLKTA